MARPSLDRLRLQAALRSLDFAEALAYALILVTPLLVYRVRVGANLSPQRAVLILLVGLLAVEVIRRRRMLRLPRGPTALALAGMLVFLLYELTQFLRTDQTDFAVRFIGGFAAGLLVVAVLLLVVDTPRRLTRAVIAFAVSGILPVALGFYQLLSATFGYVPTLPFAGLLSTDELFLANFRAEVSGIGLPRIPSTLAAPAFYGEFLVLIAVALLVWFLAGRERRLTRLVPAAGLIALVVISLIATLSRSAWILFAVGLVVVLFQTRRDLSSALLGRGRRWVVPATALAMGLLLPILSFSVGDVFSNALDSLDFKQDETPPTVEGHASGAILTLNPAETSVNTASASTETHISLRENAVDLFLDHPLFGVGLGNYGVETGQPASVSSAQSYGFTVLAEGGLIGLALFGAMLASLIVAARTAYRWRGQDRAFSVALLSLYVMVALLVVNNLFLYDTLYRETSWVVIGLALAGANVAAPSASREPD